MVVAAGCGVNYFCILSIFLNNPHLMNNDMHIYFENIYLMSTIIFGSKRKDQVAPYQFSYDTVSRLLIIIGMVTISY